MAEDGKTVILGVSSTPMHLERRVPDLVRSKSVLKLSSDAVVVAYCRYEALEFSENSRKLWKHFYPEFQSEYPRYVLVFSADIAVKVKLIVSFHSAGIRPAY